MRRPNTTAHIRVKRESTERAFTAAMAGAAFGATALCCKIAGLDALLQCWAALTLVVMLGEATRK